MSLFSFFKKESSIVVLLIVFALLYFHFTLPKYSPTSQNNEFAWDILSYYLYLPLSLIHGDIGINDPNYIQHIFNQYHFSPAFYQAAQAPNGNWVMIYTSGMAILYSPFFLIAHIWASSAGYPADGFSYPYQFCISSGMMIYSIIGILFFRKILLRFFNERITVFVMVIILIGTNFFREATDYTLGPHAVLFSFYCVLIYYTIKWHENQKKRYAAIIGFSIGFLTLIRPTEAICIFIPIFWNVYNQESFKEKFSLLKKNRTHFFTLIFSAVLVGIPQMMYWKHQTGSFLYNSYWNQNSFDISESHLTKILFSIRKGWFIYTPLIILSIIGFFYLKKEKFNAVRFPVYIFIAFNIFILSHVPVWFNAGSFGQRFMVQSYAILAIPLGAFLEYFSFRSLLSKFVLAIGCALLVALNVFQTWQMTWWILPGDGITWAYYKQAFLKTDNVTKEEQNLLDLQRTNDPNEKFDTKNPDYRKHLVAFYTMDNFNTSELDSRRKDFAHSFTGKASYKIDSLSPYCKFRINRPQYFA